MEESREAVRVNFSFSLSNDRETNTAAALPAQLLHFLLSLCVLIEPNAVTSVLEAAEPMINEAASHGTVIKTRQRLKKNINLFCLSLSSLFISLNLKWLPRK